MENWLILKGKIIMSGVTIKQWCKDNDFDIDRLQSIRSGLVKATEEEQAKINKILEG